MEIRVPTGWVEVDSGQFDDLLKHVNYERDAYSNGEWYNAKGYEKSIQLNFADGRPYAQTINKRVAIHTTTDRYFVDPEFFGAVAK